MKKGPCLFSRRLAAPIAALLLLAGCSADRPLNPSFPLRLADAKAALTAMADEPRPFARPVVVLGGIHDPGFVAPAVARKLERAAGGDAMVLGVSFFGAATFDECRRRVIAAVDEEWPGLDPEATVEVDAVGISMGGLVARYATRPVDAHPRRLRIRRLFTIGTPHVGAKLADVPTFDRRIVDMRRGSEFLARLNTPSPEFDPEIFPYTRLDDGIVGEAHTAPPDRQAWWVANIPFAFSHLTSAQDPRFLADIAKRLRGETPFTISPAAPLPSEEGKKGAMPLFRTEKRHGPFFCNRLVDGSLGSPAS